MAARKRPTIDTVTTAASLVINAETRGNGLTIEAARTPIGLGDGWSACRGAELSIYLDAVEHDLAQHVAGGGLTDLSRLLHKPADWRETAEPPNVIVTLLHPFRARLLCRVDHVGRYTPSEPIKLSLTVTPTHAWHPGIGR